MKNLKRVLALFLVLTLCFSLLPLSVFAEELEDEVPEESVLNEDLLEEVPQEPAVEDKEGASAVCEHDYIAVVTEPTDMEGGYTTFTCSLCGDSYVADYTEALLPPAEEEADTEHEADFEVEGEADAEEDEMLEAQNVDSSVIVGFAEPEEIFTDYKMALVTLQERFPVQLAVSFGGTVFYAQDEAGELLIDHTEPERTEKLDVVWLCEEDYDEDLEEFHFIPALDNFVLAEGVELPRLVVHVGPGPELPELRPLPKLPELELPIVGFSSRLRGGLPTYYNLYEEGVLPPIRDQGTYGNCWSFATIGSLEADLIHDGVFDTGIDLSELHLVYYTYFPYYDEKGCSDGDNVDASSVDPFDYGGNAHFAFEGLSKMLGPAWEYDVPYTAIDSYRPGPVYGRNDGCSLQMTGAYMMRADDRNAIKQSIMDHGGVCTSVYWNESCYSATHNSYYTSNNSNYVANHAIMLVGWDDSFPASNFTSSNQPQNPGAWLVRNSWGKNAYGKYGYFWLSYEGLYTAEAAELDEENNVSQKLAFAFDAQSGQYDHCYAFDGSPAYVYYKCNSGVTVSQSFTVDAGETIEAVGFETLDPNLQLQITVSCGGQTYTATKATQYAGFYLIPIDGIEVETQSAVTVSVKLSGSETIQVPVESNYNYGDIVYTASCGSGGLLLDNFNTRADGRVKLFTTDSLYTITYDANGGTGAPAAQSKPYGAALTLSSTVPTREGYIFLGWATSRTATEAQYQPGASYTAEDDATLYAVWQPKTYLITYDANGGMGAPSAQTKIHATALTLSGTTPTREGYDFVGWATSLEATQPEYQPGDLYQTEAPLSLYALWQIKTYTVGYDANEGTGAPEPQTKTHFAALTLSDLIPTREGYDFLGWAVNSPNAEAQYQPGSSFALEGNTTLYAVWQLKTYTVSFDANGGEGAPIDQIKTHFAALTLSDLIPSRQYYDFLGWAIRSDANGPDYQPGDSYLTEASVTLFAVWTRTIIAQGESDEGIHWTLYEDGELVIAPTDGTGCIAEAPWLEHKDQIRIVTIKDGVTKIGENAFKDCENLTDVSIPDSVTEIGSGAFAGCTSLTNIVIPTGAEVAEGALSGLPEVPTSFALDHDYLALIVGETTDEDNTLHALGLSDDWLTRVRWTVSADGTIPTAELSDPAITVKDGVVTAQHAGTVYAIAWIAGHNGEPAAMARCRVDVVEAVSEPDPESGETETHFAPGKLTGVRLVDPKATVELYKTDYTRVTVIPELSQNSTTNAVSPTILTPENNPTPGVGMAIESARLAEVKPDARHAKAEKVFLLSVVDDRTLEIIPDNTYITADKETLKALKGSYKATVYVTVDGTEFEAGVLTLTVKKTLPKLTAKALKLNSYYADTKSVIFTGSVPVCNDDYDGGWFFFDAGSRTITYTGALNAKQAAYKLTLPVKVEGWAVEMPVTVSVSAAPAAPKLTVKAVGTVDLGVSGSAVTLVPTLKNYDGQADLSVTKITDAKGADASDLFEVSGLAITAGENVTAGKYKATVTADISGAAPVSATVQFTVKAPAKAAAPTVTLKATGFIDVIRPESAVTITPTVKGLYGWDPTESELHVVRTYSGTTKKALNPAESADDLFKIAVRNGTYVITRKAGVQVSHLDKFAVTGSVAGIQLAKPLAFTVKMGTAKVTQSVKTVTLLKTDKYSSGTVVITTTDETLAAIDWAKTKEVFDAQNSGKAFAFRHLGNGECVIGYTDYELPTAPKAGTVKIPVFFTGNLSTKPNATLSVSVKLK